MTTPALHRLPAGPPTHRRSPPSAARPRRARRKAASLLSPAAPTTALRFRGRGRYKCVVNALNQSCTGVHPALHKALAPHWNYDRAKAEHRLLAFPAPPGDAAFLPKAATTRDRHLAYGTQQGHLLDTQLASIVQYHTNPTMRVPLDAFFDAASRQAYCRRHLGASPARTALQNLCKRLLPEAVELARFLHAQRLDPVATQVVVAWGTLGTKLDLLCRDEQQRHRVLEIKNGCEQSFSDGRPMRPPLHERPNPRYDPAQPTASPPTLAWAFSTHLEHLLQTAVTDRLYRYTFPQAPMGPALLVRCDRTGTHAYHVPALVNERLPRLMMVLQALR